MDATVKATVKEWMTGDRAKRGSGAFGFADIR
jgi:hypothetical protein